ncbi:hypothetical protein M3Y99_01410600 [Aphelenchoides fujianensis]|nr:hypothetical protein M3Y99_01410600 [Aphelenchoides fujianensis]
MILFEMFLLPLTTIVPGYFSINGHMYCSSPKLQLFAGITVFSLWIAYSVTCFILSLNRCLAQTDRLGAIFEGKTAERVWLSLPFVVFFTVLITSQPSFYSSIHGAYFFNPHAGYFPDSENKYPTALHLINNLGFAIIMPSLYLVYFVSNLCWSKQVMRKLSVREYSLFLQVLVINGVLAMTSTGYVMMQYIRVPPVVYLCLNVSMRRIIFRHPGTTAVQPSGQQASKVTDGNSDPTTEKAESDQKVANGPVV